MRPTGNCRPALLLLETAFLALFPLPRPDMIALRSVNCYVSCECLYGISYCSFLHCCLDTISYISFPLSLANQEEAELQYSLPNLVQRSSIDPIGPLALWPCSEFGASE